MTDVAQAHTDRKNITKTKKKRNHKSIVSAFENCHQFVFHLHQTKKKKQEPSKDPNVENNHSPGAGIIVSSRDERDYCPANALDLKHQTSLFFSDALCADLPLLGSAESSCMVVPCRAKQNEKEERSKIKGTITPSL